MTDVLARGSGDTKLTVRGPAYGVIAETLRLQADTRPKSRLARAFGADPLHPNARLWYRGAIGELEVARHLKNLGPEWTLLHTVVAEPTGREFDHLVIGPPGLFSITIKDHSGQRVWVDTERLLVNGHRTDHLRDARQEAASASRLLSTEAGEQVTVFPLVSIVNPGSLAFGRPRPRDVTVVASSQLARTLRRRSRVLTDSAILELSQLAEQRGPWRADAHVLNETLRHEDRFASLKQHVDAAARRRALWITAAALAPLSAAAAALLATAAPVFALG